MKVLKWIMCFVLCLLLTASLFVTTILFAAKQVTGEEEMNKLLSWVTVGERVLGYEKAEGDGAVALDDAVRDNLGIQNVTAIGIYADNAQYATMAGLDAIKTYVSVNPVFLDFSDMASAFTEGYIAYLKEYSDLLDGRISYINIQRQRVTETKETYTRNALLKRVEEQLEKLATEGKAFGKFSLDGENVICYTGLAGDDAANAENALYFALEGRYDETFREYLRGLIGYLLKSKDQQMPSLMTEDDVVDLFVAVAKEHGLDGPLLTDSSITEKVRKQARSYVLPAMRETVEVPYAKWFDPASDEALAWVRRIAAIEPLIPGGLLCLFLLFLLVLIGGRTGVGFGSTACLLSGALVLGFRFTKAKALAGMKTILPSFFEEYEVFFPNDVVNAPYGKSDVYGLYILGAGVFLLAVWFVWKQISRSRGAVKAANSSSGTGDNPQV